MLITIAIIVVNLDTNVSMQKLWTTSWTSKILIELKIGCCFFFCCYRHGVRAIERLTIGDKKRTALIDFYIVLTHKSF